MKILVVEDDNLLNTTLCYNLINAGYTTISANNAKSAIEKFKSEAFDLIVLDVNLPDGNGFDLCREFKEINKEIAIIFLTANDMESDMIKGFELGADDYVTKPFPINILQRKITALLSRVKKQTASENIYDDGSLIISFDEMSSSFEGNAIQFTPLEYRLLKIFTLNPNIVLTRQILLEKLWDIDEKFVDEHALTAAISRVRRKIEIDEYQYIKTVYGMGYMWVGGIKIEDK